MSAGGLSREDLLAGLQDLIDELASSHESGTIRIVGGAAIWLAYSNHRSITADIDAWLEPRGPVLHAAARVAARRGYRDDWLNDAAARFIPSGLGREAGWVTILDRDGVIVQIADDRTLLAMKLQAVNRRGVRDMSDIVALIGRLALDGVDQVDDIYDEYFPGDALNERARELVAHAFATGIPPVIAPPPPGLR